VSCFAEAAQSRKLMIMKNLLEIRYLWGGPLRNDALVGKVEPQGENSFSQSRYVNSLSREGLFRSCAIYLDLICLGSSRSGIVIASPNSG
jgi:hypothetical protein